MRMSTVEAFDMLAEAMYRAKEEDEVLSLLALLVHKCKY